MAIITGCVLQAGTIAFDGDATLAKAESLITEAGRLGARIAVLPGASSADTRRALTSTSFLALARPRDATTSADTSRPRSRYLARKLSASAVPHELASCS
jgi:hypothetical protein